MEQSFLPTLACDEPALGINIKKDVVPTVIGQPFIQRDGLAFVNGHWVIAPKPWRAIEGKTSVDDEPAPTHDKPPPKKKPKGSGKKR